MGIAGHGLLHQIHTGAVESGRIQKERDSDYDNTAKNHAQIRIRCYKIVCSACVVHDKAEQDAYDAHSSANTAVESITVGVEVS